MEEKLSIIPQAVLRFDCGSAFLGLVGVDNLPDHDMVRGCKTICELCAIRDEKARTSWASSFVKVLIAAPK